MNYLGLEAGWYFPIIKFEKFNLSTGPFIQLDFLLSEKESNHKDSTISTNSITNAFNWVTGEFFNSSYSTYEVNYNTFDAVKITPIFLSIGNKIKASYNIRKLTYEINYSFGINISQRYYSVGHFSYAPPKNFTLFSQLGIQVNYSLYNH